MADVTGSGGVGARNCMVLWSLKFDDVANTVTITATHTHFDGTPCPDPTKAWITTILNTSLELTVDLLTGEIGVPNGPLDDPDTQLNNRQPFVQGSPLKILNAGPRARTNVRLKVSVDRVKGITFSTQYIAPVSG